MCVCLSVGVDGVCVYDCKLFVCRLLKSIYMTVCCSIRGLPFIGLSRWYTMVYRAAMSVWYDGTQWCTVPPCRCGTMVHNGVPCRHVVFVYDVYAVAYRAAMSCVCTMVHNGVPCRHVGLVRWYAIAYRAAISCVCTMVRNGVTCRHVCSAWWYAVVYHN